MFGVPVAPEDIGVQNPAFDVTPARYVTAIICEHGVARAPYQGIAGGAGGAQSANRPCYGVKTCARS